MGTHIVVGTLDGIGRQKEEPAVWYKISGALERDRNDAFRGELIALCHKFSLRIEPHPEPVTLEDTVRKQAKKGPKKKKK